MCADVAVRRDGLDLDRLHGIMPIPQSQCPGEFSRRTSVGQSAVSACQTNTPTFTGSVQLFARRTKRAQPLSEVDRYLLSLELVVHHPSVERQVVCDEHGSAQTLTERGENLGKDWGELYHSGRYPVNAGRSISR